MPAEHHCSWVVSFILVFSERKLTFTFAICRRLSVCRLSSVCRSLTFVRPTQAIEIFGNIFTSFGILAISDLSVKILRKLSQRNLSVGGLNARGVAKYSDFGPVEGYISETVQVRGMLILIANRKTYMRFRLVPKSVTLNDLERRNSSNGCVISRISVAFRADYVKWLKIHRYFLRQKCSHNNPIFSDISFMAIMTGDHP